MGNGHFGIEMDHAGILAVFSVNIEAHTGGIAYNSSNSKCLTITVLRSNRKKAA